MSKFNNYAKRVDEIAKAAFEEYRNAVAAHIDAEEQVNKLKDQQKSDGASPQLSAKIARAEADLIEAKAAYRNAPRELEKRLRDFERIRKELAAEIEEAFSADPAQLDANTLELMKSGILTASEYAKLLDAAQNAGNPTMTRLIGKYATDAAKAYRPGDEEARVLNVVVARSRQDNGSEYLKAFDYMVDVYGRAVRNPAMMATWEELTARVVETF